MTTPMQGKRRFIDPRSAKQLGPPAPKPVRNFAWSAETVEQFAQQHPDLMVREGDNELLAQPLGEQLTIYYAFDGIEEMRQRFSAMLERIEPVAKPGRYKRVYITFDDHPNRTFIEPLFRQNAFEVAYEWLHMLREDLTSLTAPSGGPAVRTATAADLEAIASLEAACYEAAPLGLAELKEMAAGEDELLLATQDEGLVGYALLKVEDQQVGQVARLGVHPEYRRRGVGYALMTQVLARLASVGRIRATALAPINSKAAVSLCRKVGFVPRHTVLLYAKESGARPKRTLGLIGIRGIWE